MNEYFCLVPWIEVRVAGKLSPALVKEFRMSGVSWRKEERRSLGFGAGVIFGNWDSFPKTSVGASFRCKGTEAKSGILLEYSFDDITFEDFQAYDINKKYKLKM